MKATALAAVEETGITQGVLREQWDAQATAQTRPAPRKYLTASLLLISSLFNPGQSKLKANQAIQAILALDTSIQSEQAAIKELQVSFNSPSVDIVVTHDALESSRAHLKRLERSRALKFSTLGVDESIALVTLKSNKYLTARMNALALKHRLRDRLRQRKFEMERLERSYRRTMNGMF